MNSGNLDETQPQNKPAEEAETRPQPPVEHPDTPDLEATTVSRPVSTSPSDSDSLAETQMHAAYQADQTPENAPPQEQTGQPAGAWGTESEPSRPAANPAGAASYNSGSNKPVRGQRKNRLWLWVLGGVLLMAVTAAFSIYSGYQTGIADRESAERTQTAAHLDEQFVLAMQDLEAERYEIARQRFNYIIQNNPSYPGVIDGLTRAELAINITATPTVMPTPTLTPTPDTRGVDALFDQARAALEAEEWSLAIDNLLALRKADSAYRPVDVDGMLYLALRNRGVDKILRSSDLEGGTYDLALAERFGPLDIEAHNYRLWVNLYVTGASFWDIDWAQAVYYFSQLYPLAPGLRDASGWTVADRYSLALRNFADTVARDDDWCQAQELYESALAVSGDPGLQDLANEAARNCSRGGSGSDDGGDDQGEGSSSEPPPPEIEPTPDNSQPTPLPSP